MTSSDLSKDLSDVFKEVRTLPENRHPNSDIALGADFITSHEHKNKIPVHASRDTTADSLDSATVSFRPVSLAINDTYRNIPIVSLDRCQETVWLDFGDERKNFIGKTRYLSFGVEAPASTSTVLYTIDLEKIPEKKGFKLVLEKDETMNSKLGDSFKSFSLNSGERELFRLSWTPVVAGGVREAIYMKFQRGRIRIVAHGHASGKENNVNREVCKDSSKEANDE